MKSTNTSFGEDPYTIHGLTFETHWPPTSSHKSVRPRIQDPEEIYKKWDPPFVNLRDLLINKQVTTEALRWLYWRPFDFPGSGHEPFRALDRFIYQISPSNARLLRHLSVESPLEIIPQYSTYFPPRIRLRGLRAAVNLQTPRIRVPICGTALLEGLMNARLSSHDGVAREFERMFVKMVRPWMKGFCEVFPGQTPMLKVQKMEMWVLRAGRIDWEPRSYQQLKEMYTLFLNQLSAGTAKRLEAERDVEKVRRWIWLGGLEGRRIVGILCRDVAMYCELR